MEFKSFLNLALLLCIFSLALMLPHQVSGSSRGVWIQPDGEDSGPALPDGMCSTAVTIHGYKCQEFSVTTDDGYILSVQRIPEGRAGGGGVNRRQPVLLQHGVLVDGMTWLMNSPDESLAMILADKGFDVWISNIRGTRFSLDHTNLSSTDPAYWDWSWDELVTHDLPVVIDLVFTQTGQKIHYVGHSLGTLIALASFSEGKQIDKVKSAVLLSPIAYLSHMTTALGNLGAKTFLGDIGTMFGLAEFSPMGKTVAGFLDTLCTSPGIDCHDLITAFSGSNCCLNTSTVAFFLGNALQPTATKNLVHLSQTVRDGVLSKYDYGDLSNMIYYNALRPPVYDLSKIPNDLPMFLSYGGRDALSDVSDVEKLLDDLKNHDEDKLEVQCIEDFAHADFIIGSTAKYRVYNSIVTFFKNHH